MSPSKKKKNAHTQFAFLHSWISSQDDTVVQDTSPYRQHHCHSY